MATRARMTWNMDDYFETLLNAEKDIDQAVTEVLSETSQYVLGLMTHYLFASSETWTGGTAKTLFVTPVQRDGNYIFVELGADVSQDPAGFHKEYGRPRQAAEPFLRPTLILLRTKELRRMMGKVLERYGLPTV